MTRIRILRAAEEELRAAAEYYDAQRAGLGRALITEVRRTFERIAEQPLASRIARGDVRARIVSRFPYKIFYRVSSSEIVIVAIGHRRRRPGYWRRR